MNFLRNCKTSFSAFMRRLGIYSTSGGTTGGRTRLKNQMIRLFHASIQLVYEDQQGMASITSPVASQTKLWWEPHRMDDGNLWESKIRLGEDFFNEIISHGVPLNMNILKALKRSSLGLDLYQWLTYRTFVLKQPLRLSWTNLYRQFGADPAKASDNRIVDYFRTKCLRELKKIKTAWPELNYQTERGVLVLLPSAPAVTPTRQARLVK